MCTVECWKGVESEKEPREGGRGEGDVQEGVVWSEEGRKKKRIEVVRGWLCCM